MSDADFVWAELARHPIRRAMLGRERCDAITAVAAEKYAALRHEYASAVQAAGLRSAVVGADVLRERLAARVRAHYADQHGFAFMTLIVIWAISAIAQALVIRWLNSEGES
jgi:hypothetical protein